MMWCNDNEYLPSFQFPDDMPAWKRAILSKQRERMRALREGKGEESYQLRKTGHYYDRDGRKVEVVQHEGRRDDDRRKGQKHEERRGRRRRSEEDEQRGRRKTSPERRRRKEVEEDKRGKKKQRERKERKKSGPTNIDDFDEDDFSDSYSSGSESDSDSEGSGKKNRKPSSSEVMRMLGMKWALGDGDEIEDLDERIRVQQQEIQRELSNLTQLQRANKMKVLPSLQQKVLHNDLQKLQDIQTKLKENPGVRELQMLLVGQQMLLCEHLKDIQSSLGQCQPGLDIPEEQAPRMPHSTSTGHLQPSIPSALPPIYNPMLAATEGAQLLIAAEQARQQQLAQQQLAQQQLAQQQLAQQELAQQQLAQQQLTQHLLAQRRQQQLLAAAQLSAGLGGLGMASFSPLTPSVPLL